MKEIRQARIILANIEPQIDSMIEQAQQLSEKYNQLQMKYNLTLLQVENLNKQINELKENGEHDTNDLKS